MNTVSYFRMVYPESAISLDAKRIQRMIGRGFLCALAPVSTSVCSMSYKTILVHVESAEAAARLRLAVSLALSFDAALIGLGARGFDAWPDPTGTSLHALQNAITEDLRLAEEIFYREAASLGQNATWRSVADLPADAIVEQSFAADLIVASRPQGEAPAQTVAGAGDLILGAGAPVLVAPPDMDRAEARRIVIAWKNKREARRAIWDALPLLKRAEKVHLVRFLGGHDEGRSKLELAQLVKRLSRHGVRAEAEVRPKAASTVTDDLLDYAQALSADMIVTGAYSRSRLQERILGGVTQGLLSRANKVVLFSH